MPKVINVFVSQIMHGRDINEIIEERGFMLKEFKLWAIEAGIIDDDDVIKDCNSGFDAPATDSSCGRLWYLGRSIQAMDDADFVIFHKNCRKAKGCQVEMAVASRYFQNMVHTSEKCHWGGGVITPLIGNIYFNKLTKDAQDT